MKSKWVLLCFNCGMLTKPPRRRLAADLASRCIHKHMCNAQAERVPTGIAVKSSISRVYLHCGKLRLTSCFAYYCVGYFEHWLQSNSKGSLLCVSLNSKVYCGQEVSPHKQRSLKHTNKIPLRALRTVCFRTCIATPDIVEFPEVIFPLSSIPALS